MKVKSCKRALSLVLALMMALSVMVFPASAAASVGNYDGGLGTETSPYLISNETQLISALTTESTGSTTYYKLTADITLTSEITVSTNLNASIDLNGSTLYGSITVPDDAALTIKDGCLSDGTVTINGGTVTFENLDIFSRMEIYDGTIYLTDTTFEVSVYISGGYFMVDDLTLDGPYIVVGGSFNVDVSSYVNENEGYSQTYDEDTGRYTVVSTKITLIYVANADTDTVTGMPKNETTSATSVTVSDATPTREGYTFTGWNTEADGSGMTYAVGTAITESTTLYAQWEEDTPTSTAIHIYNSMTLSSNLTFNYLIKTEDLADVSGYTLTVTKTTTIDGTASTTSTTLSFAAGTTSYTSDYWVAAYDDFYAYEYGSTLTVVLKDSSGNVVESEVSYDSVSAYLTALETKASNEAGKTIATATLTYCAATKAYYEAQTGSTVG